MLLENYISQLLYRYDCVVVPNFGGFLAQKIPSQFNPINYTFSPPSKELSFNINLTKNDGLLLNYISQEEKVSYEEAQIFVEKSVKEWQNELAVNKTIIAEDIGVFKLNNYGILDFKPVYAKNYLTDSYGLSKVNAKYILKETSSKKVNKINSLYKVASVFLILILVGGFIYLGKNKIESPIKETWSSFIYSDEISTIFHDFKNQFFLGNVKTESADKTNPVVPIQSELVEGNTLVEIEKPYYIIVGAFKSEKNSNKFKEELIGKGYLDTQIFKPTAQKNYVSVMNFTTEEIGDQELKSYQEVFPSAWLYKKTDEK